VKRLAALVVIVLLALAAVSLPQPDAPAEPEFPSTTVAQGGASVSGVWYCVTTQATLDRESVVVAASSEAATAEVTFPNPVPGEEPDRARLSLGSPGAGSVTVSDVALRGDAPSLVEFSTPRATAFAITSAEDMAAGDVCAASVPKIWHLPGASTPDGRDVVLRLFNPFPEIAKVTITASSELGVEPLPDLEAFSVPARSWSDIEFGTSTGELRGRETLEFTIIREEGLVLPALLLLDEEDEAYWPGTGLSTTWEFPVVGLSGSTPTIHVANPSDVAVTVEIDLLTPEGEIAAAVSREISPGLPTAISLVDVFEGTTGVRVRSSGNVAAVAVADGGGGLAGTVGTTEPQERWMAPGVPAGSDGITSLWVLNSGDQPATVTVRPLGVVDSTSEKVLLDPGSVRQVILDVVAPGYLVEALTPISVSWSQQSAAGVTFVSGAPAG
jgi:hypothetical protein